MAVNIIIKRINSDIDLPESDYYNKSRHKGNYLAIKMAGTTVPAKQSYDQIAYRPPRTGNIPSELPDAPWVLLPEVKLTLHASALPE